MSLVLLHRFRTENKRDKCYRPYFTSYTQLPTFLCDCRTVSSTPSFHDDCRREHNERRCRVFRRWERAKREARKEFEYANYKFQMQSLLLQTEFNDGDRVGVRRECVLRMLTRCTKERLIYLERIEKQYLEEEISLFFDTCRCDTWQQTHHTDFPNEEE